MMNRIKGNSILFIMSILSNFLYLFVVQGLCKNC